MLAGKGVASSVGLVPGKIQDKENTIIKLAELLEVDIDVIKNKLSAEWVKDDSFVPIKTIPKVSELELMKINPDENLVKLKENIKKTVIAEGLTQRQGYDLEQHLIEVNKTYLKEYGYNGCIKQGRTSEEAKIIQSNPNTKAKHGAVMKARWSNEEQRALLMEATQNEEVKAKRAKTREERKDMYEQQYIQSHPEYYTLRPHL